MAGYKKMVTEKDRVEGYIQDDIEPYYHPLDSRSEVREGSPNVFINGKPASYKGASTWQADGINAGFGDILEGSPNVFINGKPAAFDKCRVQPYKNYDISLAYAVASTHTNVYVNS